MFTHRRPRLVLFDLDDTLCDHDTSLRSRLRMAFGAACDGLDGIDVEAIVDASARRAIGGTDHFADVLASFGVRDDWRVARAVELYSRDRYSGLELFEEALEVVEEVKRHAGVGMITNGPSRIQRDKIERLAIAHLFPFILVSEEEGISKPDPAIFHRALELGGAQAHEAAYVGDSPENDVAGARAAGLTSVWINRTGRDWPGGPEPDCEIRNLREILSVFAFQS